MADSSGQAKTSIDSLVELLHSKGRMELHQIALTLAVDPTIVESWAKVLEEGNLARIVNEVGKMYVEPITITKEQEQSVKAAIETEKSTLITTTTSELSSLENLTTQINALAATAQQAERLFREKMPHLEMQLRKVNKMYSRLMSANSKMESIKKRNENVYEHVNKRAEELLSRVEVIDPSSEDITRGELVKMKEALKAANEFESQIHLIKISKDKAMDTIRKSMKVQVKALEKELNKAEYNVDAQLREYEEQLKTSIRSVNDQYRAMKNPIRAASGFKREAVSARKTIASSKSKFNDEYTRVSSAMIASETSLAAEIKTMLAELDSLKASVGTVAELYDHMQKTKEEVTALSKRVDGLKQESNKIIAQLNALETMKSPLESKLITAANLKKKIKDLDNATTEAKADVRDLSDKIEKAKK